MKNIQSLILCVALSAAACSCSRHKAAGEQEPAKIDVARPVVESVVVRQTYPGTIKAFREVELVARVNGTLHSCNYVYGDLVKKGDVLFTIEDNNYRDAVARAQSTLSTAVANQEYAAQHYAAVAEAYKSDAVSKMEVEQAKSNLEQCNASIAAARAELQTAQTQLSYCTVRAPFDGHVSAARNDVGSYLAGEGAPVNLATIYEDNMMVMYISIDDAGTLAKIKRLQQQGNINLDSIPISFTDHLQHSYTAKLDYMSPNVNTSTGTVELQGLIDNRYGELKSGMFASVALPLETDSAAILIRDSSIGTDQLGKYVYTVNDSDVVVYTPVKLGSIYADSMRIVSAGLGAGSRYVTKAMLKVRDGEKIAPVMTK